MGRFINADGYTSVGQDLVGNNMFAYCSNNPVMGFDPHGEFDLLGAAAGFAAGFAISVTSYVLTSGGNINVCEMLVAGAVGGVAGVAASINIYGALVAGVVNGVYTFCTTKGSLEERMCASVISAAATSVAGAIAFTGCDKLLNCVNSTAKAAYCIGSVGINYTVGQVAELVSVGTQKSIKVSDKSVSTNTASCAPLSSGRKAAYQRKTWDLLQEMY